MKKIAGGIVIVFLVCVAFPAFGSTIYDVSVSAAWTGAELGMLIQPGDPGEPSPDPIVLQFVANFEVYSDGDLVPGTMSFGSSEAGGQYFAGGMYFGPPPPCNNATCESLNYGTVPPYTWSESTDSFGYYIELLPLSWPPSGSVDYNANQTVAINCLPQGNDGCALLGCTNIGCATGATEWASYGTLAIEQIVATPEPGTALLLFVGIALLMLRRERHGVRRLQPRGGSYVLSC